MAEAGLTKNQILAELSRSPHGKLNEYVAVGQKAARQEAEFFAHLIAWDRLKGQVRDAKVALPVVFLSVPSDHPELAENSFAHLALLGPRELLRAYRFALELKLPGRMRELRRLVEQYLRKTEADTRGWKRLALQHRHTLKELYALAHIKPAEHVNVILYGRNLEGEKTPPPQNSVFAVVSRLKDMSSAEAAGTIMEMKIPFLIARGALGAKAKEPDLVLALINRMSATELVTNTKSLESLGVKTNPALRGAFEQALAKASKSTKNVLKTTRAAEAVEDEILKEKLRGLQERQIKEFSGVEGNWLVLGDKSTSMSSAIDVAKMVAATLAKMVKGKVYLVFFDSVPQTIDVTGASLDVINKATKFIQASGSTSIGCGLKRMLESKAEIDGIAIVSDAQENTAPRFVDAYKKYSEWSGKEVPVYLYRCDVGARGWSDVDLAKSMAEAHIELQEFDVQKSADFYALPNTVQTMRTNRYSLIDEVMAVPLLSLANVFKSERKEELAHVSG